LDQQSGADQLEPDEHNTWLTEGMQPEFAGFLPIGTREAKSSAHQSAETVFGAYSLGVATNRDSQAYAFSKDQVERQADTFVEIYNQAVDILARRGPSLSIESLVDTTDGRIKWTRQVKASLAKLEYSRFKESYVRSSLYRPFTRKRLYFDEFWNEEQYQQPIIFPTEVTETENTAICLTAIGSEKPFMALMSGSIVDLHLVGAGAGTQCFPYYIYNEDGSGRRENITDWALARFQAAYGANGPAVTKRDIFAYVYGVVHHPFYRERYAANLKRETPGAPID
jgi:predicted helicase